MSEYISGLSRGSYRPWMGWMASAALLHLKVAGFSALHSFGGNEREFGPVHASSALSAAMRRRLSAFDQAVARCVLPLAVGNIPIVFASRYGNMGITVRLLDQCIRDELLSPAAFSASVHNAASAFASQIVSDKGGHTAIAGAGVGSLRAGLTETYCRLCDDARAILFVYADAPLPDPYTEFDEGPHDQAIALALRLEMATNNGSPFMVGDGRRAAIEVAENVGSNSYTCLAWRP